MFLLTPAQIGSISRARQRAFVARLDGVLCREVGVRWSSRSDPDRRETLQGICDQGISLGIDGEHDLAQFVLLHMVAGREFIATPAARTIVDDANMDWRQKMYQLVALAGFDAPFDEASRVEAQEGS